MVSLNEFLSSFDGAHYPEAFLQKYELMECLAHNEMGETLLVRDRFGTPFIAKCYTDASLLSRTTEDELLKKLRREGLPAFTEEFRDDETLCVVREYAQGTPLSRLKKPLADAQAIDVGVQLCDILSYLHGQQPPVIHRDIKPQNIVRDDGGRVTLIDFGISRVYDENARADTVFFGTQEFAPPEQYGFAQTDARADIFSLGVVLSWLLTGRTQGGHIQNPRLARIVRKCTAFAPQARYRDARRVKAALLRADGHAAKRVGKVCAASAALLAALIGGFALGRFTEVRPALFYDTSDAVFADPLMEQAVRYQLGKAADEPLESEELAAVTEICICGDAFARTRDEFFTLRAAVDRGDEAVGSAQLASLSDVAQLPNLQALCVGRTALTDISAVAGLQGLETLVLSGGDFTDISAVGGLKQLRQLTLDNCDGVRDISAIVGCSNLTNLVMTACRAEDFSALASLGDLGYLHLEWVDPEKFLPYLQGKTVGQLKIGGEPLTSFEGMAGIQGLKDLILNDMQLPSMNGIETLASLEALTLTAMPELSLEPLLSVPHLKTLTLSEDMREAGKAIEGRAPFDIIYQ